MALMPLLQPRLNKPHLLTLRALDRARRQTLRRLIRKQTILIPMVHRPLDQHPRLTRRTRTIQHIFLPSQRRKRRNRTPRISLSADVRKAGVRDIAPAVLVDDGHIRWGGEVERIPANLRFVLEGEEAGDQRELVGGDAGAGLKVAPVWKGEVSMCERERGGWVERENSPLRAILIRPAEVIVVLVRSIRVGCSRRVMAPPTFIQRKPLAVGVDKRSVHPPDVIQHAGRAELARPTPRFDQRRGRCGQGRGLSLVGQGRGCDVPAVLAKRRVIDFGVPITVLPVADPVGEDVREVVVVGEGCEAERGFQLVDQGGVLRHEDRVGDIDQFLLGGDAGWGPVFAERLVVAPVVPEGVGHTRGGDAAPPVLRVQLAEEGHKAAAVRAAVGEVGDVGGGEVEVFEAFEDDVFGEIRLIGQGLVGCQEAEILGGEVWRWEAGAVVAVLEHNTDAVCGFDHLMQ
jgi:hypothetical protein